jgi:drug/metabolite transporter (DMT)-like permease
MLELAPRAALVSLLYITASFGATFWAERTIDSATAAQVNAVSPIVVAALSFLFLKKRLGLLHWAGIVAGFAGVWLIVRGSLGGASASAGNARLAASIVMVSGVVAFSAAQVLYRRLFGEGDDPFTINSLNMLSGGIGLLVLSLVFERRPFPIEAPLILSLAYLIVLGSLVGHSLNLWLVKCAGPLFASSWSYVSPAIATAAGAVFMSERIDVLSVAGMAATLAGVALIARAERPGANGKKA